MTNQPTTSIQFQRANGTFADVWTTDSDMLAVHADFVSLNNNHIVDECRMYQAIGVESVVIRSADSVVHIPIEQCV